MAEMAISLLGYGIAFVFILAGILSFGRYVRSSIDDWKGDMHILLTGLCMGGAIAALAWTHWVVKMVL